MAVSKNWGPHFGSPYNKDPNIFGSILGPPICGSPHMNMTYFGLFGGPGIGAETKQETHGSPGSPLLS